MLRQPGLLRTRTAGFSLIEVLVAVLIVGVGVLGIVGLQLVTLRTNTGAMMRSQATQYAYNIIDRVRANSGANYVKALTPGAPAVSACQGGAANCTIQAMANDDIATWLADVGQLPSGQGRIAVDDIPNGKLVRVTVQWADQRRATDAATTSVTVGTQIKIPAP